MAVDDAGDDVGEVRYGSTPINLQVSMSEAITAQCSAPPSEPANRAFLRVKASGRMVRSTTSIVDLVRPSPRNRHRPCQRDSA